MEKTTKTFLYRLAEPRNEPKKDQAGYLLNTFIIILILLNCSVIAFETFEKISSQYRNFIDLINVFSVTVFTIEYLFRVWVVKFNPDKNSQSRLEYLFSPMAIVDFLAIIPFYISAIGYDLRWLRILRTFRLFKLGRYTEADDQFWNVIKERKKELIISLFFSLVLMFIASYLVFLSENPVQPDKFDNIFSGIAWAVATLTPGPPAYEFAKPVTMVGKFAAGFLQVIGIAVIALPTGIIGGGFAEKLKQRKTGIALELMQYQIMMNDSLINSTDYAIKKKELLDFLIKKDFLAAEKYQKLEYMMHNDLINKTEFKTYEEKILKGSDAASKRLELMKLKEKGYSYREYEKEKKEILKLD
jgi:voltage-gated potassium channel|tara:strand:+ start:32 stop:1105 length:1074 start_codon:yes stop_codon:yes gene_type:complete